MMYSPLVFDPVNLFAAQSVAASTTSDPSARLETTRLTKVQVRVKNTGASTNVTVNIYSVDAATNGIPVLISTFTLGAGNVTAYTAGRYIEKDAIPRYIYAQIVNSDAAKDEAVAEAKAKSKEKEDKKNKRETALAALLAAGIGEEEIVS